MPSNNNLDSPSEKLEFHQAPVWFTKDYMQKVLQTYKNDSSLIIVSMNLTPATAKGQNYASIMTRCKIVYRCQSSSKSETKSYILKSAFENEFATEKMKDYDVFKREMDIYKKIIPKLNLLLSEINDSDIIFVEAIYVDYENIAMIFDDLSVKSFTVVDRLIGLDMEHTKLALRKLAKLHATSAVLNERYPGTFETYDRGFYNKHTVAYSSYFVNCLDACGQMVSKLDNDKYKVYGDKIKKLLPYVMEYGTKVFDARDDELNAFAHGDIWITNIMYSYHDITTISSPRDAILIDFQYSVWTSPATDLQYFFNTSLKEDLRLNCQDELIQYYYYILADTLRSLKFRGNIPSLHEFWIQFQKKSFFGLMSCCVNQAVALNEKTENADFQALMGDDKRSWDFKHILYTNERIQENLKNLLPIFDRRGLLDIM